MSGLVVMSALDVFNQHLLLTMDRRLLQHELLEPGDLDCIVAWISHSIQQVMQM